MLSGPQDGQTFSRLYEGMDGGTDVHKKDRQTRTSGQTSTRCGGVCNQLLEGGAGLGTHMCRRRGEEGVGES